MFSHLGGGEFLDSGQLGRGKIQEMLQEYMPLQRTSFLGEGIECKTEGLEEVSTQGTYFATHRVLFLSKSSM